MPELSDCLHREGTVVLETIEPRDGQRRIWQFDSPREILRAYDAASLGALLRRLDAETDSGRYASGYLAYEAGYALLPIGGGAPVSDEPLAWFGIYDAPREGPPDLAAAFDGGSFHLRFRVFDFTREAYAEAFRAVKHHVFEGDAYQINLTGRFSFLFEGSVGALYADLVRRQRNTLGGYLHAGERRLLSRSPELFFLRDGDRIVTRPMKGTVHRGKSSAEDAAHRVALAADPKSRAENLMIVDLLRNDLSVVCEPGTVRVPALFATEVHETLIQMTSTVEGKLRADTPTSDVIRALFPCGSVTGAPKIRAMQIIRAL
ncbi:MAG TPA: chorismate-binding protein, partial [Rhodothermales bacterium]